MGRPRKTMMSEGKKNIIAQLIEEYDIHSAQDIEAALRDLLGGTIQSMLESELETQMEQSKLEEPEYSNSRNGYKPKTLKSNYGAVPIQVPQDRKSDFEPKIVPKYGKDISAIEGKIIGMYARGMSTRQISEQIEEIYGFEVSEGLVTAITNKLVPEIEAWQKRPLSSVYPIVFIDAIVFNVRENGVILKQAAYVILGVSEEGRKEVLTITIGEKESSKYWLLSAQRAKKPRRCGYFCSLRRRVIGGQRSHRGRLPADRISALHRACRPKHAQICGRQRQKGVCGRFKEHLSCFG